MATNRAYTWFIVTYATGDEYKPLLNTAKHWALAYHDQDFIVQDDGTKTPKEPHTHIIVTFDRAYSLKQVREMVESKSNTLAQACNTKDKQGREVVRGMFKYLCHEEENPETKYIYDKSRRRTDDDAYWQKRIGEELTTMQGGDFFLDDLLADDFSCVNMAKKYGRDFMKNYGRYCEFRREARWEMKLQDAQDQITELISVFKEYGIPIEDLPKVKIKFTEYIKQNYLKEKKSYVNTYYRKL